MRITLKPVVNRIKNYWINTFWKYPRRLFGFKLSLAVMLLSVSFTLIGNASIGIALSLGAVASALSETDDYPKGRIKTLAIMLLSFFIASISVEILRPYPILFCVGLVVSTFSFIIIGGMGERYRGITYGALLIAIYTMLSTYLNEPWYYHPLLLTLGALFYGLVSLALLYIRPWRLLNEQLAVAYRSLADYTEHKAKFFPSPSKQQDVLRNQLAQKNINIVNAIKSSENALKSYAKELHDHPILATYYQKWLVLQKMHERVASSHERYDLLSEEVNNPQLIEGFGQLLIQLSVSLNRVATSFIINAPYKHPVSLSWMLPALEEMLQKNKNSHQYPALSLLLKNLTDLEQMLYSFNNKTENLHVPVSAYYTNSIRQRLSKLLKLSNPRFRHAVRLSVCFSIAYVLILFFNIEKGDWILLTSFFVCQQTYSETRQRLVQRVMGTLIGVLIAVVAAHLLPTKSGQIVLLIMSIYLFARWLRMNYSVAVIFITIFVLAAFNIQANSGVAILVPRLIDTLIGAFLAFLSVRFIWPDWQYKHLPDLLQNALNKNIVYLDAIANSSVDSNSYITGRHSAHEADTSLTLAWRGIKVEPKQNTFFEEKAFTITYMNHTLLSYISALGAYKHNNKLNDFEKQICQETVTFLTKAEDVLQTKLNQIEANRLLDNIQKLKTKLLENEKENPSNQFFLLFNIVQTTRKLLEVTIQLAYEKY